jgi:hypothetical protein
MVLVVGGCGGSSGRRARVVTHASRPLSACLPAAARIIAGAASGARVSGRVGVASSGAAQCVFGAAAVGVTVDLDSEPQAYQRLERQAVEDDQQFGAVRIEAPPQNLTGLGLNAYWYPTEKQVMTTDGRRLITVIVRWHGVTQARRRALARAVARRYLGPLDRRAVP